MIRADFSLRLISDAATHIRLAAAEDSERVTKRGSKNVLDNLRFLARSDGLKNQNRSACMGLASIVNAAYLKLPWKLKSIHWSARRDAGFSLIGEAFAWRKGRLEKFPRRRFSSERNSPGCHPYPSSRLVRVQSLCTGHSPE